MTDKPTPTDAEILDLWELFVGEPTEEIPLSDCDKLCFARAALRSWGQPSGAGEAAEHYRNAIASACEGWTMPDGLRKHLETALWSPPTPQPTQAVPPAGREPQCWCLTCRPMRFEDPYSIRMALCPTCGNKRCPKANDHRNTCTGSNEPGQPGSAYFGGIKGGQHGTE